MFKKRTTAVITAAFVLWSGASLAQSSRPLQTPAEQPPAGFLGAQYVDSKGCIFVRVDLNGRTNWVPRLSRGREQICGASPSQAAQAVDAEPLPKNLAPAVPVVRTQTVEAPEPSARPRPVAAATSKPAPKPRIVKTRLEVPMQKPKTTPLARSSDAKPVRSTSLPGETRVVPLHVATARARVGKFSVPEGYRAAWQDDRLNPHRAEGTLAGRDAMNLVWTTTVPRRLIDSANGRDMTTKVALVYPYTDLDIQRRELGTVTLSTRNGQVIKQVKRNTRKAEVPTRIAEEAVAGQLYVQAGTFRTKASAQKNAARLKRLGIPIRIGKFNRNGETVRLVLAGPFKAKSDASFALSSVKRAGFSDAFLRD